jgi:hypothetical protein
MKGTRLSLQLEDGQFWRWILTDAEGNVVATSVKPYFLLTDTVQAIDDLRQVFSAV